MFKRCLFLLLTFDLTVSAQCTDRTEHCFRYQEYCGYNDGYEKIGGFVAQLAAWLRDNCCATCSGQPTSSQSLRLPQSQRPLLPPPEGPFLGALLPDDTLAPPFSQAKGGQTGNVGLPTSALPSGTAHSGRVGSGGSTSHDGHEENIRLGPPLGLGENPSASPDALIRSRLQPSPTSLARPAPTSLIPSGPAHSGRVESGGSTSHSGHQENIRLGPPRGVGENPSASPDAVIRSRLQPSPTSLPRPAPVATNGEPVNGFGGRPSKMEGIELGPPLGPEETPATAPDAIIAPQFPASSVVSGPSMTSNARGSYGSDGDPNSYFGRRAGQTETEPYPRREPSSPSAAVGTYDKNSIRTVPYPDNRRTFEMPHIEIRVNLNIAQIPSANTTKTPDTTPAATAAGSVHGKTDRATAATTTSSDAENSESTTKSPEENEGLTSTTSTLVTAAASPDTTEAPFMKPETTIASVPDYYSAYNLPTASTASSFDGAQTTGVGSGDSETTPAMSIAATLPSTTTSPSTISVINTTPTASTAAVADTSPDSTASGMDYYSYGGGVTPAAKGEPTPTTEESTSRNVETTSLSATSAALVDTTTTTAASVSTSGSPDYSYGYNYNEPALKDSVVQERLNEEKKKPVSFLNRLRSALAEPGAMASQNVVPLRPSPGRSGLSAAPFLPPPSFSTRRPSTPSPTSPAPRPYPIRCPGDKYGDCYKHISFCARDNERSAHVTPYQAAFAVWLRSNCPCTCGLRRNAPLRFF